MFIYTTSTYTQPSPPSGAYSSVCATGGVSASRHLPLTIYHLPLFTDLSYTNVPLPRCTSRGYTGHEHLAGVNLINMNGRVYDPLMGMFLSPDPVLQSPNDPLNYNRYSYCLNNPLKYTDPSGEFFLTTALFFYASHIGGVIEAINNGGLEPYIKIDMNINGTNWTNPFLWFSVDINTNNMQNAWTKADPFLSGTRANNFWKITGGLFQYDKSYSGKGDVFRDIWEVAARFTPWQGLQTNLGYAKSQALNAFYEVDRVEYFYGATVLFQDNMKGNPHSFGGFITLDSHHTASLDNELLIHEYGHYRQLREWGPLSLFSSIHSGLSAMDEGDGWASTRHRNTWWEMDANSRSFAYLSKYMTTGPRSQQANYLTSRFGLRMRFAGTRYPQLLFYYTPWAPFVFYYNITFSN